MRSVIFAANSNRDYFYFYGGRGRFFMFAIDSFLTLSRREGAWCSMHRVEGCMSIVHEEQVCIGSLQEKRGG